MNYKPTRIGLINFWLYDEEIFEFEDGKLLLRGTNGSGKSVTMQSFIPLILDGNKSPARLDPFGSKDKRIEDYLLGSADGEQKEEAIAYLFMELYNTEKKKYVTLGIGLYAKKGRPTDFWAFIIKDGRRIGEDILLYHSINDKIPCTKKELRAKLGVENIFVETAKEYKEAVNKHIFGFPDLDMYDEFINLLLQIRSPKLSKDYKPTKLMEILSGVLQPLTDEDLRPLSEAIEEMDKTKEKIEKIQFDVKQLANLLITYGNYNETILYKKAENYIVSLTEEENKTKELIFLEKEINKINSELEEKQKKMEQLEIEKDNLETKRANIDSKDLDSKINRLTKLEEELKLEQERKEKIQTDLNQHLTKVKDMEIDLSNLNKEKDKKEVETKKKYNEIQALSEEIKFTEASVVLKDFIKDKDIVKQFSPLKIRINNYKTKLKAMKETLEKKKNLEEKRNEIEVEAEKQNKEYIVVTNKMNQTKEDISEAILDIKDQISYIGKTNQILKLSNDEIKDIISPFSIYEKLSYATSKEKYLKLSQRIKESITKEIYNIKSKITVEKEKAQELTDILARLQESEELEIERETEEEKTIAYLNEKNIPFVEFYKAIEFKENIKEEEKNILESTLISSGMLQALIVEDIAKVKNRRGNFLTPSKKYENNLTKYFNVVENLPIKAEVITKVLESINIDTEKEIVLTPESFSTDFFHIQGTSNFKSTYIGILSRQKAKEKQIKEISEKIESKQALLNNLESLKLQKEQELETIAIEEDNFPSNARLQELEDMLSKLEVHEELITKQKNESAEKLQEIVEKIDIILKKLIEMKNDINFPLDLVVFEDVIKDTELLFASISEFEILINSYYQYEEQVISKEEQINDRRNIIEDLNGDFQTFTNSIRKKEYEKEDLNKVLESKEYKDLSEKIIKIETRLKGIEEERLELKESYGKDSQLIENQKQKKEELKTQLEKILEITRLKENFFKDEYNLHYVVQEEIEDTKKSAKQIMIKLASRKDSNRQNVTDNYYKAYNDYRTILNDYHIASKTIFDNENIWTDKLEDETLKNLYEENKRADLTAMYQGKKLNLYALSQALTEAIEENNQIINEQDRRLFKEILLKTVGTKIRERIESSKNWVKMINEIMQQMQQGSSLSFSLEWKSKSAEAMEELDTKELVRIFQIDASMLTDADSTRLNNHFQSKLKRLMEINSENLSYTDIIFEVLDYRNWFEFKMSYQRKGENKKELTNKVFSVFSGGEKAKTMYIPLFAAVYAKLMSAKKDAPRIIALDEAFAGVDDTNIREMFGILSSLNLDYILTSQALWADYDTVSSIAISELLRPNNAQSVCVRRYRWNGNRIEIIRKKELEDATSIF